jgi:HKD family nuclease
MTRINHIAQPIQRSTLNAIEHIANEPGLTHLNVAAAYITTGGLDDLLRQLRLGMGNSWTAMNKQWLTSFDYLRTQPVALRTLMLVPTSEIRIYDANFCLDHAGWPRIPFHPKAFLFRSDNRDYALVGSGNISRSGLSRGIEAGLDVSVSRMGATPNLAQDSIRSLRDWFGLYWQRAAPLTTALLNSYETVFEGQPNLKNPAITEDDVASSDSGRGALSSDALHKLRICRHFWIEAGNITRNRGQGLPGNQLMMRRLSRVFFGFSADSLPQNTAIGHVEIVFNNIVNEYSLTYSDNGMDKLVLPIPGAQGPPAYDNEDLLFEQLAPRRFRLSLGRAGDKARWLKKSRWIEGDFRMSSGRQWGVF